MPYFDSEMREAINIFNEIHNRTPNHKEMLKILDNTINDVNTQHIQQGFVKHKIVIDARNSYAPHLIEGYERNKQRLQYFPLEHMEGK